MASYITRLSHFRFSKKGDTLIITSERDPDFEERYDWPEEWSMTDEDLASKLHEEYYTDLMTE